MLTPHSLPRKFWEQKHPICPCISHLHVAFLPHSSSSKFPSSKLGTPNHDVLHEPISPEDHHAVSHSVEWICQLRSHWGYRKIHYVRRVTAAFVLLGTPPTKDYCWPCVVQDQFKITSLERSMEIPCQSPSSRAFCSENQQASKSGLRRGHICTEFAFIPTRVPKQCQCQPEVRWMVWEPKAFFAFCSSIKTLWVKIKRTGVGAFGGCGFSQMPKAKY